ncbi:hypothetical protein [Pedobacter jamesrossensis]|uniref:Right handed beta helix region n=1 Tax=Pedobacter jamesrossensis TaxID=1908238 RepID=A0ABV8NMW8_9SPHI
MKRFQKMQFIVFVLIILFAACKKNNTAADQTTETPVSTTPPTTSNPIAVTPSYEIGTGSGNLTIDGKSLDLTKIKLIKVKAGTYKTITVLNIAGTVDQPVLIKNNGQVNISESLITDNISNLQITGDYTAGITYGFSFTNIGYRAISLHGKMSGLTLKNMSFKNVNDYTISGDSGNDNNLKYAGTAATRTEGFKILNCLFDNAGAITFGGNLNKDSGEDSGFFKDVEIAYNTFQNTNVGSLCSFTNVQDYNIHHNVVNNVNPSNNNHNGIFSMQGNGKFHDNKCTNYQGNSIRMWLYSRGSTPATNEIYNNICFNTRKYGGFELQAFDRNMYPGKTTFANAKVYNNTVGQMNTSKDWEGQVLDLYNTGGTLEFYNNLGFNLFSSTKTVTNMINNMSDTKIIKEENNKYTTQSSAISDLTGFVSLLTGIGASLSL